MKTDEATKMRLQALDRISQVENAAALAKQRAQDGQVAVRCPKCGAESILDANRPEKAPKARCGASSGGDAKPCGAELQPAA